MAVGYTTIIVSKGITAIGEIFLPELFTITAIILVRKVIGTFLLRFRKKSLGPRGACAGITELYCDLLRLHGKSSCVLSELFELLQTQIPNSTIAYGYPKDIPTKEKQTWEVNRVHYKKG